MHKPPRLFATVALALSLSAAAAPSSVMPRMDMQSVESADAVIAGSAHPGTTDCPTVARTERQQRADRLATMMMRHSMVSRLALGKDMAGSTIEEARTDQMKRHDDSPHSCG